MKKGEKQKPEIYYDRLAKLRPDEKQRLREILTSELFVRFLRIVASDKPSANCTGAGSHTRDPFSNDRANARLGEIRGWELYEFAIFKALTDTPITRTEPEATYPNSGMPNLEPKLPNA